MSAPAPVPLFAFRVGEIRFAVPARAAVRLATVGAMSPLPQSPAHVVGLGNLQGNLTPLIDLSQLGEFSEVPSPRRDQALVLEAAGLRAALFVDEALGHEEVPAHHLAVLSVEESERFGGRVVGKARLTFGIAWLLHPEVLLRSLRVALRSPAVQVSP